MVQITRVMLPTLAMVMLAFGFQVGGSPSPTTPPSTVAVWGEGATSPGPIEIVFSFDTTGSMYPVIGKVRRVVSDMVRRLQSDIPGIRIAVFAHGDWEDADVNYATKWWDFTTDVDALQAFINGVEVTSGGDTPEAYELVLHQVRSELSWTPGSQRSLVMIGDNIPHEANYRRNKLKLDWRKEADALNGMGVRIYSIHALDYNAETFYRTIAQKTGGYYLKLDNFDSILNFIMAISYREHGLEYLLAYEEEVRKRGMTPELASLFKALKEKPVIKRRLSRESTATAAPPRHVTRATTTAPSTEPPPPRLVDIYSLHINSSISYRFVTTLVTSRLANRATEHQEIIFKVQLPKAALISNFSMVLDGVVYPGIVKEKEAAKRQYVEAKDRGESAGYVAAVPRNTNSFRVSVNIAASSKVTFSLIYQELLQRKLGSYEHVIHVDPGQVVRDLQIEVNIDESRPITFLRVPHLRHELLNSIESQMDNPLASITRPATNKARITYSPTDAQQRAQSADGVHGQFVVQYDVQRALDAGEIQVVDGYFVHTFAPDGLPPSPKSILFILDSSGSMSGTKIGQLKAAMAAILNQLRPTDYFNLVYFSDMIRVWQTEGLVLATERKKRAAEKWVRQAKAAGATNINGALQRGAEMLEAHANLSRLAGSSPASFLVFLTDGDPTSGETNLALILRNTRAVNKQTFTLFSLGFGSDLDFLFLTQLSLQNNGFARKIYADSDAELQLRGFYDEIATPTLSQVKITYLDDKINATTLTETDYQTYFNGSEIIVCGKVNDPSLTTLRARVEGNSVNGRLVYDTNVLVADQGHLEPPPFEGLQNNFERMWAYLTIKELLKKSVEASSKEEKVALKEKALELSLQYHFVTPLTSMVVTKPKENAVGDLVDPDNPAKKGTPPRTPPLHSSGSASKSLATSGILRRKSSRGPLFADNDPHFIVNIRGSETPVCFDVMGKVGHIFNLICDVQNELFINGLIIGKKSQQLSKPVEKPKTYFGKIAILYRDVNIIVTPYKLRVGKDDFTWKSNHTLTIGKLLFTMLRSNKVRVSIDGVMEFVVMRHLVRENHPVKVSFLGFYIENDAGLSYNAHGLLGQFKQLEVSVDRNIAEVKPRSQATLRFKTSPNRHTIHVTAGHRENLASKEIVPCWFVHNNGRHLLDGSHLDYLVPRIAYRKAPNGLKKRGVL